MPDDLKLICILAYYNWSGDNETEICLPIIFHVLGNDPEKMKKNLFELWKKKLEQQAIEKEIFSEIFRIENLEKNIKPVHFHQWQACEVRLPGCRISIHEEE